MGGPRELCRCKRFLVGVAGSVIFHNATMENMVQVFTDCLDARDQTRDANCFQRRGNKYLHHRKNQTPTETIYIIANPDTRLLHHIDNNRVFINTARPPTTTQWQTMPLNSYSLEYQHFQSVALRKMGRLQLTSQGTHHQLPAHRPLLKAPPDPWMLHPNATFTSMASQRPPELWKTLPASCKWYRKLSASRWESPR